MNALSTDLKTLSDSPSPEEGALSPVANMPSRASSPSLLWRNRALWRVPLVGEAVLLVLAAYLALAFGKVMTGQAQQAYWVWVLACGVVFVSARAYAVWHELFMPRVVALFGLVFLGVIAAGLLTGLLVPEPWHAAFDGLSLTYRALAGLPLIFFLARSVGLVMAARFTPSLQEIDLRAKWIDKGLWSHFCRRLEFWMR
jgi:hypothetical protein